MAPVGGETGTNPHASRYYGANHVEGIGLAPDAIRAELSRILQSDLFVCSERLSRFLRFAVEQVLAGRAFEVKESVLAVEIFDRETTFDSRVSSIVRVEARRLREKLQKYYETEGREARIRIELPTGSYVPRFRRIKSVRPERRQQMGVAHRIIRAMPLIATAGVIVIAAVWLAPVLTTRSSRTLAEPPVMRLTSDTGLTYQPTLSLASNLLAYASDRAGEGGFDIWVQPFEGGQPVRLTDDAGNDTEPAFSPDGRTIAFHSDRDGGGIYLVSALGGNSRLLARGGRRPRFSPDGRLIAFWVGNEFVRGARIFIVGAAGGQPTRLVPDFRYAAYPVWSPDGRRILFIGISKPGEAMDWWVAPVDGGSPVRTGIHELFRNQGLERLDRVCGPPRSIPGGWLRDGHAVFPALSNGRSNIWCIHLSVETGVPTGAAERLTFGVGHEDHPSVAAGDEHVVFSVLAQKPDIWHLPVDADTGRANGVPARLTKDAADNIWPQVSSDGRMLVFLSNRDGNYDVFARDLQTGVDTALTSTQEDERCALISMDGSRVAFGRRRQRKPSIYSVSTGGGEPNLICEDCGDPRAWSPDNQVLLYQRDITGISTIWMLTSSGARTPLLRSPGESLYSARFSPDGRWIAFLGKAPPESHRLVIVPFRGPAVVGPQEWIPLEEAGQWVDKPRWSPDGNLLYFLSNRDGSVSVWGQRLSAADKHPFGEPFPVWHIHASGKLEHAVGRELAIAQGGIFLSLSSSTGNISVMALRGRD